jgi:hypothetical protein
MTMWAIEKNRHRAQSPSSWLGIRIINIPDQFIALVWIRFKVQPFRFVYSQSRSERQMTGFGWSLSIASMNGQRMSFLMGTPLPMHCARQLRL